MSIVLGILSGVMMGMSYAQMFPPFTNFLRYTTYNLFPNLLPEAAEHLEMWYRGVIDDATLKANMRQLGYDETQTERLKEIYRNLPTLSDLIDLRRRKVIDESTFKDYAKRLRFSEEDAERTYQLSRRLLGASEVIQAFWRGIISQDEAYDYLERIGYDRDVSDKLLKIAEYFPTPSDLVRFAVREVYTPEVVSKFRLDEDLPPKFLEEAKKAGLPEEQATNYWRAHWELPSAQMGYEMYHRGIITREELELLLRTLDVMPFWRDKLIELAYEPYTRVDVRRMYHAGVLTKDEVYRSYLDLGYSPEKAEKMTQWTLVSQVEEEKTLTKSQILEMFEVGEFDRNTAKEQLKLIGYSEDAAEYLIKLREHEIANRNLKDEIDLIKTRFIEGEITLEEFNDRLTALGLKDTTIQKLRQDALRAKAKQVKMPSKDDVLRWYELGIIKKEDVVTYLTWLNFKEDDIFRYIAETDLRILERLRKAEKPPKLPELGTLFRWLGLNIISEDEFRNYMTQKGYSVDDIRRYLEEFDLTSYKYVRKQEKPPKTPGPGTLTRWLITGLITPEYFVESLLEAGYKEEDVETYMKEALKKMEEEKLG